MAHTIQEFGAAANKILKAQPNAEGRNKVCALLEEYLQDPAFVAANLKDDTPERKVIYEDKDLGFCVLAHHYRGAKESAPHDHGPYWAIYGQAVGETEMSDFDLLEAAGPDKTGKVRRSRTYKLLPGMAHVYNEGDLHAPKRVDSTMLIRIEGRNMEQVKRHKFEAV